MHLNINSWPTLQGVEVTYKHLYNVYLYNDCICAMAYTLEPSSSHGSLCCKTSQLNKSLFNLVKLFHSFFKIPTNKKLQKDCYNSVCPAS